jgi:hypothetical protein
LSTKRWLTVLLVTVAAFGLPLTPARAACDDPPPPPPSDGFTIVALPDTQNYTKVQKNFDYFLAQTEWIKNNKTLYAIVFVTHEGDLIDGGVGTNDPVDKQWERADEAMDALDEAAIPYSASIGDHDYDTVEDLSQADNFVQWFGPDRYQGQSWYGGSSAGISAGDKGRNHYQLFTAGGRTFLHLNLEWEVSGQTSDAGTSLGWAHSILSKHPDTPTIITTHSYLKDTTPHRDWEIESFGGSNPSNGERIFQQLVKPHEQVFMVLNGNWHESDGEYHQRSEPEAGQVIDEMLANYQTRTDGGQGLMRLIEFLPSSNSIDVYTISPGRDASLKSDDICETDADSRFSLPFEFDRLNSPPTAEDDVYTVTEGEELVVSKPGVLGNDSDPDGDGLTATLITGPLDGSVQLNADGSFTYAHAGGTTATDIFTYRAGDGTDVSNDATVTITVKGSNDDDDGGASTFTDIQGHVFEDDIIWLADRGITKGCNPPANDLFCPDDLVTRGQMAAFLNRALNLPSTSQEFFTDDNGSVFEGDINRLAAAGITKGCNPPANDQFCPTDRVTRGQMASFLVRALGLTEGGSTDFFSDDNGNTHEEDINRLATADITRGCAHDLFCPKDFVSRGQMAAFLHRGLG